MHYLSIFRPDLFAGQTIIVTGGGTGIGRAIAHELASLGAHLILAARKMEQLERVVKEIENSGGSAKAILCNIRKEEEVRALFDAVLAERGAIHGLVNNAGGQYLSPAQHISTKGWHAVIDTNLTGTFLMCREAYNRYMGQPSYGGAIVNIVSEMWRGYPGMAHSGAARAAVVNLTKTLAVEWAKAGVRINSVAPGLINSSSLLHVDDTTQAMLEPMVKEVPAKRMGTESEVAAVVTFLLSPAAAYISGETIKVDGASSLWRKSWEIEEHENSPSFDGFVGF